MEQKEKGFERDSIRKWKGREEGKIDCTNFGRVVNVVKFLSEEILSSQKLEIEKVFPLTGVNLRSVFPT